MYNDRLLHSDDVWEQRNLPDTRTKLPSACGKNVPQSQIEPFNDISKDIGVFFSGFEH